MFLIGSQLSFAIRWFPLVMTLGVMSCSEISTQSQFDTHDSGVTVIELDAASVRDANASPYVARSLPAEFYQVPVVGARPLDVLGGVPEPAIGARPQQFLAETVLPPSGQPSPYRIGVGDLILVSTPQRSASSVEALAGLVAAQNSRQGYTVQDDGAIAIPDVGRVVIAGMQLDEAEDALFRSLVDAGIEPSFSLEVAEFNSQRVAVGGEVANPGFVPITLQPLYLDQVIAAAGGVTAGNPSQSVVRIYRNGSMYQVPVDVLFSGGGMLRILMRDGDNVFVDSTYDLDLAMAYFEEQIRIRQFRQGLRDAALRELQAEIERQRAILSDMRSNFEARRAMGAEARDYAYVIGEVVQPARFELPYENVAVLADAIMESGGVVAGTGNPGQIYVLRGGDGGDVVLAYHLDASNAANFVLAVQMELRPGDVIYVAERGITSWNRVISQVLPTLSFINAAAAD